MIKDACAFILDGEGNEIWCQEFKANDSDPVPEDILVHYITQTLKIFPRKVLFT